MMPPFGSVQPMLAIPGTPFDSDQFAFEVKWDGFRALAFLAAADQTQPAAVEALDHPRLRLQSRNGKDLTPYFPELQSLAAVISSEQWPVLLDGEIVALVAGRPDFSALQAHLGWQQSFAPGLGRPPSPASSLVGVNPPTLLYVAFDVLFQRGQDLRHQPWQARREILSTLLPAEAGPLMLSKVVLTRGRALFAACRELGLEGTVAKRLSSPYQPGRSHDWIKSRYRPQIEALVGGWLSSPGPHASGLRLLLGLYPSGPARASRSPAGGGGVGAGMPESAGVLQFIGVVGTGWTAREEQALFQALRRLEIPRSPFADDIQRFKRGWPESADTAGAVTPATTTMPTVHWAQPVLVVAVEHSGWTAGHLLRQPVWKGWRPDKDPTECWLRWQMLPLAPHGQPPASDSPDLTALGERQHLSSTSTSPGLKARVGSRTIRLTHTDRLLWPQERLTKGELIAYYHSVSSALVAHLRDRLVTITRYPDGIDQPGFYQKHLPEYAPDWIGRIRVTSASDPNREPETAAAGRGYIDYPQIAEPAALVWFANQAAIEFHPSLDRIDHRGYPDYAIFDLDPNPPATLTAVREVALRIRDLLDRLGLRSYPKLTGATGLHIYVPLAPIYSFDLVSEFVAYLGELLVHHRPDQVTNERLVARRGGRVYIDHLQNRPGKTIVAVLSLRPLPGAPISTPVTWDELERGMPGPFSLANPDAVRARAQLFDPVLRGGQQLEPVLPALQQRLATKGLR